MTPETASGRKLSWPAIVALALVPLLVVGAFIGLAGRDGDEEIQAAVVNLDQAVEMDGQLVPLGRQLAAEMLERDGDNISWTLADAPSASAGLKTGEYAAVVTIPEEFSASATSFSANDADAAQQATIRVQVSDNAPVTDAALAQDIARLATNAINETLTEGYLDGIYVGFNTVGDQFSTIVDGAAQLNDGTTQLADGTREAAQGATQLSDGMVQLQDNGPLLADGGNELVIGIGQINDNMPQLADGTGQLAAGLAQFAQQTPALMDGVAQLRTGADQLAAGSGELASGASDFADGVDQFATQTPQLLSGVGDLAAGADQLLPGVAQYADGAAQAIGGVAALRDGLDQMVAGLEQPVDTSGLDQLAAGVQGLEAGAAGLHQGLTQVDAALGGFSSGAAPLPAPVAGIPEQIGQAFQCPVEDSATCTMLQQTFLAGATAGVDAGFKAGTRTASAMLTTPDPDTGVSLLGGAAQLAEGASALSAGLADTDPTAQMAELTEGVKALRDGADAIVVQAQPIIDQAPALGQGATQLNEGIQQLNDGVAQLGPGVEQLAGGARALADGAAQYDAGVGQYASGMAQFQQQLAPLGSGIAQLSSGAGGLATGVDQLADGIAQLETGAATYVDGVTQYTTGVASAADGATSLSDGLIQLADGADELDAGMNTFATELANGADQVPTYSAADREKLATVVASPVERPDGLISTANIPLVSLLLLAGLWLGALASFVAARPVPRNVVAANESSLLLWARTLWLPLAIVAGQGLVLGFLGGVVLELGIGKTFGLMGLLFAFGLSFVFANHALAGWFGNVGRGISVVLLAVTVALGLSSAAGWLSPIAAVSPLHNGLELVRTWLSGGTGEVGLAGVALLMFAIAAVASVMTIVSRRRLRAEQYARVA